jgi:hypothetical protein
VGDAGDWRWPRGKGNTKHNNHLGRHDPHPPITNVLF